MLKIERVKGYDRQLKRMLKKHYRLADYNVAIRALASQDAETLKRLKDHALVGDKQGYRELHIDKAGKWLLEYTIDDDVLILILIATGSHDELYK
ncbi:type II toxin-antitoxin system RelE/ParE family toxin [Lacticaseibacillus sp. N501-2]|uniref:type II toxin-antitoxin system RelE/ParE family toxin n=1 Tax=Lacticaseibacillus salsurae TaxID=3367729 RepID=UPI0038B2A45C